MAVNINKTVGGVRLSFFLISELFWPHESISELLSGNARLDTSS